MDKNEKKFLKIYNKVATKLLHILRNPTAYAFNPCVLLEGLLCLYAEVHTLQSDDDKLKKQLDRLNNEFIVHNYVSKKDKHEKD